MQSPSARGAIVWPVVALVVVGGACSRSAASPLNPPSQTTVVLEAPAVTTTGPTTTTTAPTTTTTTTTTAAPLDRSDDAVVARLEADMAAILENGPRPAGSAEERAAAEYLVATLTAMGAQPTTTEVALPTGDVSTNVLATIGTGSRTVMLGGHYDSVPTSPGADDNGSGTVVLLELARRLTEMPPTDLTVMIVFFGAEEVIAGYSKNDHHYGSRALAAELAATDALPAEMVSVDMVGYGDDMLAAAYQGQSTAAAKRLVAAGREVGVTIELSIRGDISDHEAFALAGVPAVMMWRPWNPGYHTADDVTVNWDHLLEDITIIETWLALQRG